MKSTALGAENIIFISDAHEKFYYEKLQEVRYQDVYHKALCYCLGINGDTRKNADRIYNFKTGSVKTKCLHEGWQTSGSLKVVRMAFNLYCNSTPSVWDYEDAEEQVNECRQYTVEDIFCCAYAPYFLAGSTDPLSGICSVQSKVTCHAWRNRLMLKVRLMGTKNDIAWFQKILQRHPKIEVMELSELYSNKGTSKYYRAYAEIEKSNVNKK